MSKAKLKRVKKEYEYLAVADLAHQIWREHYAGIISTEQIEYMLEHFQSVPAIKATEAEGCEYYLARHLGVNIGYAALTPCYPQGKLFISKLYLLKDHRKKGYSKEILGEVEEKAKGLRLQSIWLTVAKNNVNSISAYEHLGFDRVDSICKEIGGGFVMDDYMMEKRLEGHDHGK